MLSTRWVECKDATLFPHDSAAYLLDNNMSHCLVLVFLKKKRCPADKLGILSSVNNDKESIIMCYI